MCKSQREQREKMFKKSVALELKRRHKSAARQRIANIKAEIAKEEVYQKDKIESRAQSTLNQGSRPGTAAKRDKSNHSLTSIKTPSPNRMSKTKTLSVTSGGT